MAKDKERWRLIAWSIAWEGHIGLHKNHIGTIQALISITQKHKGILEEFQQLVGMGRIEFGSDGYWRWRLTGQRNVQFILSHIVNYLPLKRKKEQAKIVLEYCSLRLNNPHHRYSEKERQLHEKYKQILRKVML